MAPSATQQLDGQTGTGQTGERGETLSRPAFAATAPAPVEPMKLQPPEESEAAVGLRGGQRSEMCPGRFCFIIPCPIPCDFCII